MTFDIFGIASNHKLVIENDELFIENGKEKVKVNPNSLRIHVYGLDKENDDKLDSIKNGSITVCECIPGVKNYKELDDDEIDDILDDILSELDVLES